MSGERGALDPERVEDAGGVGGERVHQGRTVARFGLAAAAQIDPHHASRCERGELLVPDRAIEREPVQQHEGDAGTAGVVASDPAALDRQLHASILRIARRLTR